MCQNLRYRRIWTKQPTTTHSIKSNVKNLQLNYWEEYEICQIILTHFKTVGSKTKRLNPVGFINVCCYIYKFHSVLIKITKKNRIIQKIRYICIFYFKGFNENVRKMAHNLHERMDFHSIPFRFNSTGIPQDYKKHGVLLSSPNNNGRVFWQHCFRK